MSDILKHDSHVDRFHLEQLYVLAEQEKIPPILWPVIQYWVQQNIEALVSWRKPDDTNQEQDKKNPRGRLFSILWATLKSAWNDQWSIQYLEQSITSYEGLWLPPRWQTLVSLWDAYRNLKDEQKAIEVYLQALESKDFPEKEKWYVLSQLWRAYWSLHSYQKAIDIFNKALVDTHLPQEKKWNTLELLWISYYELWKHQEFVDVFEQIPADKHSSEKNIPFLLCMLGYSYWVIYEYEKAIKCLNEALTRTPDQEALKEIHRMLGYAHTRFSIEL